MRYHDFSASEHTLFHIQKHRAGGGSEPLSFHLRPRAVQRNSVTPAALAASANCLPPGTGSAERRLRHSSSFHIANGRSRTNWKYAVFVIVASSSKTIAGGNLLALIYPASARQEVAWI
jgi:hypothetical protein